MHVRDLGPVAVVGNRNIADEAYRSAGCTPVGTAWMAVRSRVRIGLHRLVLYELVQYEASLYEARTRLVRGLYEYK